MRKYRIRKTGEIIDVISYGGTIKERSEYLDYVSYIDSKGEEHPNAKLNLYWDLEEVEPTDKYNTITIPEKADFSEDVGFALLDRALELQKKYTELEGEIKRLYELVNDAMNGLHPLRLSFDNGFLGSIACMVCCDFRPLTEEEKKQINVDIKNMADNLKKQSE